MIKLSHRLTALAAVVFSTLSFGSAKAATFGETAMEQDRVVAVATPLGENRYDLLVIEQIPGKRACWEESGSNPVAIEPLMVNFDFTGICRRATDSNGYSIRVAGQDLGMDYMLRVVERDGELLLVGTPRNLRDRSEIVIGRAAGISETGFTKLELNPGWEFAQRTYEGKTLGHVYFSAALTATGIPDNLFPAGAPFPDVANDIYLSEIEQAVALGFIAGFDDNSFRPEAPLTREQLVSIVVEALTPLEQLDVTVPAQVATAPYPDVEASRWSAAKIEWAKQNQVVTGYPDGTFQPAKEVTRAELMAVLRRAAEYAKAQQGQTPQLTAQQTALSFADISGHWSEDLVTQMSAYCGVATPLNETGSNFNPDSSALRNYAAAATLRTLNCLDEQTNIVTEDASPVTEEAAPMMDTESVDEQ
ncbi:MAG: DUF3747 domain-containing protein [Cyanophyceae cyanobacterium]